MIHVEPPFDLLAGHGHGARAPRRGAGNQRAAARCAGFTQAGQSSDAEIPEVVRQCGIITCLAAAGDIWFYATSILHASVAASQPLHRRVLQIDYAVGQLPGGLEWLGV